MGKWKSLAFTAAFLVYELNQDRHEEDEAFKDIYGFMAGMAIGYIGKRIFRRKPLAQKKRG